MKYAADAPLGLTWANGPTSVERAYSWEPSEVIPGIDDSDILGVEAPLWSETIRTLADIDEMAFPRIAAAAEAAWSPATGSERPAHVGVVPRARRRARSAVDEPRHRLPRLGRDPLGLATGTE